MKSIVKSFTNSVICLSILAVVLGIVLVAYPAMSLTAFGIVIATFLIAQGIVLIILDVKAWRLYIPFEGMLKGILSVFFGVLLARSPGSISMYIGAVMGIWIIVSAFSGIKAAFALRYTGAPWIVMIVINVIDILLGGVILYSPVLSAVSMTIGIGVVLIAHSVFNIAYMIVVKKNAKDVEKLIVEKLNMIDAEVANVVEAVAEADAEVEDVVESEAEDTAEDENGSAEE